MSLNRHGDARVANNLHIKHFDPNALTEKFIVIWSHSKVGLANRNLFTHARVHKSKQSPTMTTTHDQ